MKNKIRILNVFFVAAIYCFVVGAGYFSFKQSGFSQNQSFSQKKVISAFSEKIFCQTFESESSVYNCTNLPAPNFKKQISELWSIQKADKQFIESRFSRNLFFTRNPLINHRISDIIFPFHYFW